MDLPQSCLDMNCSLAFSARKELVVGFEIFEGIYSHPGLRTPAECVCGKVPVARASDWHVHQHRVGQLQKKVDSLSRPHSQFKSWELAYDEWVILEFK
ncbi:uncharacterized protein LOC131225271 isoform X4 [Magnolia sinica]|uniref:uncharacterized protein LOC131225271 isoform X4 n=1 Tax=Magnolia sinica TaxID=86752 RepID=UPI00265A4D99|nr:uncharacterized protein LOC131225271 isoform X4 [Magnolia sinica]